MGLTDDEASAEIRAAEAAVDPADVATMLLSGGTTSLSKLIPRTHEDYVLNARLCGRAAGFDEQTVFMAILPLGHNYNLASPGILGAFYTGGTVVLAPGTDTAGIFRLVEQERVTVIAAVVPLISAWLASDEPKRFDHSLAEGGAERRRAPGPGAAPAPDQRAGLHAAGNLRHRRGPDQHDPLDDPLDLLILHSSGRPVCDDDEIAVVDDDGHEVPDGEAGELITRGPYTIRGYYRAPEKNREAFTADGFYRMGDIVRKWGRNIQAEGRRKDLINRGGEKISCEEVENFIHRHPKVKSACLVAMPDPVFGEKACAFVILREGESLTFEDAHRLPAQPADRQLQAARAAGGGDAVPAQPGGQDPQARVARRHRRPARRRSRAA
jgi:2,3-dihydroxybenzoate-AMP ligase